MSTTNLNDARSLKHAQGISERGDQASPASPLGQWEPVEMEQRLGSLFNQDHWFLSILEELEGKA